MEEIRVKEVGYENIDKLCRICIPPEKQKDPIFITGMELKKEWALGMLQKWGSFAKLAYRGSTAVGMIQYWPVPEQRVVYIRCIYVPERENWRRGIGTQLLSSLMEDARKPKAWFGGKPAAALVTKTFPGEKPGQYPARLFFKKKGFKQVGEDPDLLYCPLQPGFIYRPTEERETKYIPQEEDKGKAVFIYGPSSCPFGYVFLKRAEQAMKEVAPQMPIRWINMSKEPDEVRKRGNVKGCFVNAVPIKAPIFDEERFKEEVLKALG
jgi:GNAT superfamily N-acetyltransferase